MPDLKLVENNRRHVLMAIAFSTVAMIVNYAISFFLAPYITAEIGTEAYGFVTFAKTVSNYGVVLTSCLNAYAVRFITVSYHKGDVEKARKYYSSVLIADTALLVVLSVLALTFVSNLQIFFVVPDELLRDVQILLFIDIVNFLLFTIVNVYTVAGYICNRIERINCFRIILYISEAVVLIIAYGFFKPRIYYVGIGLLVSTIVFGVLSFCYKRQALVDLTLSPSLFSFEAIKELLGRGVWSALSQIGNILNSGLDLWVTNLMLKPIDMGVLSIVKTVYAIFGTLPALLTQPFQPVLLKLYSDSDSNGVVSTLKAEMKIMGYITSVAIAGFVVLGRPYFHLWTPGQDASLLQRLAIITVVGFLFDGVAYPLFYVYALTLKNTLPCVITVIGGGFNLIGMYVLISQTRLGLYAVVGTTTVIGFLMFFVFTPIYAAKCLKIKCITFFSTIIRICLGCALITTISMVVLQNVVVENWFKFIFVATLIVVISVPIYWVGVLSKEDFSKMRALFRKRAR